jgi:RHS repeat-associated protein
MRVSVISLITLLFAMQTCVLKAQCNEENTQPVAPAHYIHFKSFDLLGNTVSESRTFYDNLARPRVSALKDYVTNITWGAETVYDQFGQVFKTSFPAISCQGFVNERFLTQPTFSDLQWYYSSSNTLEPFQDIAEQPYEQHNYDVLNPGNIISTTGGNRINGEWRTSFTYTLPAAQEMYYAFGHDYYNGGIFPKGEEVITQFSKTITIDEQGDETVVFTDSEGNVLANAYSGGTSSYPVVSLIGKSGYIDVHIPKGIPLSQITLLGSASLYKIYDLKTGIEVTTLAAGNVYRIQAVTTPLADPKTYITSTGDIAYDDFALGIKYAVNYYDYALNYYNNAGNLVKTIPPKGFNFTGIVQQAPPHTMPTTFKYNTLGRVVYSSSPDEGEAWFVYRSDGKIRYSNNTILDAASEVPYTEYDSYGRPVESGILEGANFSDGVANPNGAIITHSSRREQVFTIYDFPTNYSSNDQPSEDLYTLLINAGFSAEQASGEYAQKNLSGNVAITYNKASTTADETSITWYSYDIYGRVDFIVQAIDGLKTKIIKYQYDQNGSVSQMIYQPHVATERFIHKYSYDLNGKLKKVETSTNGTWFTTQAEYTYYLDGKLKRTALAGGVQGLDFTYTLNGNLKSLNHPSLQQAKDPGGDNQDLFGYALDYYQGDYKRANTNITATAQGIDRYDGNIKAVRWSNKDFETYLDQYVEMDFNADRWTYENNILTVNDNQSLEAIAWTTHGFSGDGYIEFRILDNTRAKRVSLTTAPQQDHGTNTLMYFSNYQSRWNMPNGFGWTYIYPYPTYQVGDVFRYERSGTSLIVKQNGVTIYTTPPGTVYSDDYFYVRFSTGPAQGVNTGGPVFEILSMTAPTAQISSAYTYTYNNKKWLSEAVFGLADYATAQFWPDMKDAYKMENILYDANGNLKMLHRNGKISSSVSYAYQNRMDKFVYGYDSGTNRLNYIQDDVGFNGPDNLEFTQDIKNQQPNNYQYNDVGQIIYDASEDLTYQYNAHGLVTSVLKGGYTVVKFYYNERGQRIKKESFSSRGYNNIINTDYYVNDAAGNTIAIYNKIQGQVQPVLKEIPVYGLDRIGTYFKADGSTIYELKDHLGTVRVTFTKQNNDPVMQYWADYYPFGMKMPYRDQSSTGYRYAFQGQERDGETGREAFDLRMWDGRIGRWMTPDPYGQYFSPYVGMGNNPIGMVDPDGGYAVGGGEPGWFSRFGGWISNKWKSLTGSKPDEIVEAGELQEVVISRHPMKKMGYTALGAMNAISSNALWGGGRYRTPEDFGEFEEQFRWGQLTGDLISTFTAPLEFSAGAALMGGSGLLIPETGGASTVGVVAGGAIMIHAGGMGIVSAQNTVGSIQGLVNYYASDNHAGNGDTGNNNSDSNIPKGFKETKEFGYQHGQKVYQYKGKYYSRDVDSHNGGVWKVFIKQGKRLKRIGTADKDLNIFKD